MYHISVDFNYWHGSLQMAVRKQVEVVYIFVWATCWSHKMNYRVLHGMNNVTIFRIEFHMPILGKSCMWIYMYTCKLFFLSDRLIMCWPQSFRYVSVGRLKNPTVLKWRDSSPRHFNAYPTTRNWPGTNEGVWHSMTGGIHACIHQGRRCLVNLLCTVDSVYKNSTFNKMGMYTVHVSCYL
jgi:hypothetical protein